MVILTEMEAIRNQTNNSQDKSSQINKVTVFYITADAIKHPVGLRGINFRISLSNNETKLTKLLTQIRRNETYMEPYQKIKL